MEVMEEEDMVVAILGAGDLIGCDLEDHLSHPTGEVRPRCGYLLRALTYCELKAINLDHMIEVSINSRIYICSKYVNVLTAQMFRNYPELYMTDLNVRIMNDLTFNLKKKDLSEEISWTRDNQSQTEGAELGSHHGSVVKFVFDNEGSIKSPNLSTKSFTMGNGLERTSKTILKKQTFSVQENVVMERSHSLTDSTIPLLEKGQALDEAQTQASRLSKFRERFSTKKAVSEDNSPRNFVLDIPEIVLNSPEDDMAQ